MKSPKNILDYIEQRFVDLLERPADYAPNPIALEEVLIQLDELRAFINDEWSSVKNHESKYFAFLSSKGYGVSTFTGTKYRSLECTDNETKIFSELCDIWREYLSHIAPTVIARLGPQEK